MAGTDAILTVGYIGVRSGHSTRDVARFARYVQYRDVHPDSERTRDIDGLLRYAQYRDPTSTHGRLFNQDGAASAADREALVDHVANSLPEPGRERSSTSERAVYRMILSPADARGLDLQQLARATMAQLQKDLGAPLPRWIAAEHRNTRHPHVHIILPARREVAPGQYRTLVITRDRLARMKLALANDLHLQRGQRLEMGAPLTRERGNRLMSQGGSLSPVHSRVWDAGQRGAATRGAGHEQGGRRRSGSELGGQSLALVGRLARYHRREAERLARRRRWESDEEESRVRGRRR
jgi:hypothetical protein